MNQELSFQEQVFPWTKEIFGPEIAVHKPTRNARFFEESVELVQSGGMTREQCIILVDYVYNRPVGELHQEVGGVMVTLAALCNAYEVDMALEGQTELERVQSPEMIAKIRKKQASKPQNVVGHDAGVPTYVDPSRLMSKSERQVRRVLARYAGHPQTYFDDGEASDASEYPTIDFLRMPIEEIEKSLAERNLKKNQPLIDAVRVRNVVVDEQVDELFVRSYGLEYPVHAVHIPATPSFGYDLKKMVVSIEQLKKTKLWSVIAEPLWELDVAKLDKLGAVSLARFTFAFRSQLGGAWHNYVKRAKKEFIERQKGDAATWRGLDENEEQQAAS